MHTTITLFCGADAWLARWTGEGAAEVKRLFGTDTLPTAYRPEANASTVLCAIAAKNPDCDVRLA